MSEPPCVGNGLCLQLKAGNSYLTTRKRDGVEVFAIKKPRWVQTWMNQPYPVMRVIGTFAEDDERTGGRNRREFANVRWMEITSVLKRESENGTRPVSQIEYHGERLDLGSVMRWRRKALQVCDQTSPDSQEFNGWSLTTRYCRQIPMSISRPVPHNRQQQISSPRQTMLPALRNSVASTGFASRHGQRVRIFR